MNNIELTDDVQFTLEFLMLSDYEYTRDLNNRAADHANNARSEEYLEQFYNHFFLFKKVLDDPGLDEIKNSSEAIANMSKANQKTRENLDGYTRSLFKWIDQVLVPIIKNTQRLATAMSRAVRNQDIRTKLENSYKAKDLRTDEYQQFFRDICTVLTQSAQAIEKIQNVNNNKDVVEVQTAVNTVGEQTSNAINSINEFNTRRAGEENQVDPDSGHWFSDSYLNQLSNTMNQVLSTCLNVKRSRSTILQILNSMETTGDTQTRKINKVKLESINDIIHNQIKSNLSSISTTSNNIGKKLQQMYKMTMVKTTSTKTQVPTKNETDNV